MVALRGPGLAGVRFHPESALALDGPGVLRDLLRTRVDASLSVRPQWTSTMDQ